MNNHLISKLTIAVLCAGLFGACSVNHELEEIHRDDATIHGENSSTKAPTNEEAYYWHKGEKIYLSPISGKKYIVFKNSDESLIRSKASSYRIISEGPVENVGFKSIENTKILDAPYRWAVISGDNNLLSDLPIVYSGGFYLNDEGVEVGLSHLCYVKLKDKEDINLLRDYEDSYNFSIIGENEYMPLWITIDCINCNPIENSLTISNGLYETGAFDSVQPDLLFEYQLASIPNDPLFPNQWNLYNSGQYGSAYNGIDIKYARSNDMSLGSSDVIVAVFDSGFELTHPDLNVCSLSYNAMTSTSPSVIYGDHGTACAGIISAKTHNALGVSGIAPFSPVMSISQQFGIYVPNQSQLLANGFSYAKNNGASVISNSWSGGAQSQILEDAMQDALDNGRDGKGCIIVFSAGNANNGTVSYPASALDDIIAVGAMSPDGKRKSPSTIDGETWWGSNYGTALDIVAPGVKIPTTDRTGSAGYNTSGDYFLNFNGTSSACPHVAAVAALVISVVPTLTRQQVVEAILTSTYKLPSYSFSTTKTYGTWNQEVGYGLLNAKAAIQKAVGTKTIYYYGRTVSDEWESLIGTSIYAGGVTVYSGSKLSMTASSICQISSPLVVESGASFVIQD